MHVKDKDGKSIFGKDAQVKRWMEHFYWLLNRPPSNSPTDILPARNDLPINCDAPSETEIMVAIHKLNSGKAVGPDMIPPEALEANAAISAEQSQQRLYIRF